MKTNKQIIGEDPEKFFRGLQTDFNEKIFSDAIPLESFKKWLNKGKEFHQAMIEDRLEIKKLLTFLVNPIYDLDEAIKAGNFDWMYNFIKDPINRQVFELHNSRIPKMKESELGLIHFRKQMSTEKAIEKIDEMGFRQGVPAELYGFAKKYPEEQKKYPIIILPTMEEYKKAIKDNYSIADLRKDSSKKTSVFLSEYGNLSSLALHHDGSERSSNLTWLANGWPPRWRFLVARKKSALNLVS